MYANTEELLVAIRYSIVAHPAEREALRAIGALVRENGLEAGIAAFNDWQNAIASGGRAESPQPVVDGAATQNALPGEPGEQSPVKPEPAQTRSDAPDDALRTETARSTSGGITEQSAQPGEADAGAPQAAKPDVEADVAGRAISLLQEMFGASLLTPEDASQPDSPTRTDAGQEAPGSATAQSTLPGEVQAPSVAPESPMTRDDAVGDTSPTTAPQSAPKSTTVQSTLSGKADSQPDDAAARLQAQIAGCLELETDPALRLFLKQLARDAHKYPAEFVRQELDAYTQAANPDDFLNRLAALHWQWALDDTAADPDGNWLKRGNAGQRQAVLARIQANFEWESQPILRCYLASLARQAVTDPVKAADGLEGYLDGRASPTWVWLAAVFVCGSPEAAFEWRLQELRRKVTDARLLGYLGTLEQAARRNLPAAAEKLEALAEIAALLDGQNPAGFPAAVA